MRAKFGALLFMVVAIVLFWAAEAVTDEPMFVRWLVIDDPGDETILNYWERFESEELDPPAMVDLGTMLFYRGYPKDAVRIFKRALDLDPDLYEAWFRIGLVEHSEGDLDSARQAYKRSLKKLTGHGWCNFYLGLLEEQLGRSSDALYYYRRALKFAPELADPKVNPEVMASRLMLGVQLQDQDRRRFKGSLPMPYLEPGKVKRVRQRYEPTLPPEPEGVSGTNAATGVSQSVERQAETQSESRQTDTQGKVQQTGTQGEMGQAQPHPTPAQPVRPPRPVRPSRSATPTSFAE